MAKASKGIEISDPLWVHKPAILLDSRRIREFWPVETMACNERVNAFSRFILYLGGVLYAFTSNPSYAILAVVALGVVGLISKSRSKSRELFANYPMIHHSSDSRFPKNSNCILPTEANPFGNVPVNELSSRMQSACNYKDTSAQTNQIMAGIVGTKEAFNNEASTRQFYQMPVTDSIADTDKFGKFLYGQGPNCKSDPSVCTGFDLGPKSNVPFPFV